MSTTRLAVTNYRFVIVFTVAALVLGVLGYVQMPRQEDPTLPAFGGIVTVIYPSATPEEIEDRVLEPIEEAIHELEEVDTIESIAGDGIASITAEFYEDADKDEAYDLLVQRVSGAFAELPAGVVDTRIAEMKPSSVTVLQAAIHGAGATHDELRVWAEELETRWRTLPDIKEVRVEGEQEREVHVVVDPERAAAAGLSLGQVSQSLAAANGDLPGGTLLSGPRRLSIRPNPRFENLDQVRDTVLKSVNGRPVRLGDLAEVRWGSGDPQYLVRYQGEPAVLVTATLKEGRNVFDMTSAARRGFDEYREQLPPDLEASIALDQSEDVSARLNTFGLSLLQGGAIIVVFVALLVGWRAAVVAITAMFLAVGISFWLMNAFGLSLQQMSIAGLVVVLGLLVDNAVVVFESILHERHKGRDAVEAAIHGTDRVATAVVSATATTVAAFAPMLFMAGSVGDFTRDIPTVVSIVLLVSLAMALFVTPLLATRLFASEASTRPQGMQPFLDRVAQRGIYARTLDFVQARPRTTIFALLGFAGLCIALGGSVGMNFFPRADDKPQFLVRVKTPEGTGLPATYARAVEVEDFVRQNPMSANVVTNVGNGSPMIYYNTIRDLQRANFAELLVTVPRKDSQSIPGFAREIRERFAGDPRFEVETKLLVQGPPVGLPVSIQLKGPDLERLRAHADRLEAALREVPGAINVGHDLRPGPARLDLRLDPVKVNKLGLNSAAVAREIRLAMAGATATTLRQDDEEYDVVVRVATEGSESLRDLERVRIPVPGGDPVPLAQLTQPDLTSTYARIMHSDLERSVIVGADVDGRLATEVAADLMPAVRALDLDGRESWEVIGEDEERDRAFLSMLQNVVTAMGLIYGILVLQFQSFKLPLVIFTSIPVALAGSVLGLLVGGWPFGFTAFIGLLALVGIVVNDAIVLVDRILQYRREGESLQRAVRHAAQSRLQPILLTTLTTQAGLLPLTLFGGSMWGPMGWVIIGGLTASTLVTLVMVPALVLVMERGSERAGQPHGAMVGATATALGLLLGVVLLARPAWAAPVSLDDVLARVDEANPTLAAAREDVCAAEADWRAAKSTRWPALKLDASWAVTNDPSQTFGIQLRDVQGPQDLLAFDPDASVDLYTGSVSTEWTLYDRSRGARVGAAREGLRANREGAEAARLRLRFAATSLYFQWIQARNQVEVQRATLALVDRQLEDAQLRLEAGRTVEADVLGLRARRAQVQSALVAAEGAVTRVQSRLAELLAVAPPSLDEPDPQTQVLPAPFENRDEFAERALDSRPEMRAARAQLAATSHAIGAEEGQRWPRLVARASADWLVPERDFDREDDTQSAALALEWLPFRGGGIGADVDRARADGRRAEHELEALRHRILRESVEAWTLRETARLQFDAARVQREAADEAFRIVSLRYAEGRDTLTRLLEAERALTDARTSEVLARAENQVAEARMRWIAAIPLETATPTR